MKNPCTTGLYIPYFTVNGKRIHVFYDKLIPKKDPHLTVLKMVFWLLSRKVHLEPFVQSMEKAILDQIQKRQGLKK